MRGSYTTEPSGVSLAIRWPGLIGLRGPEPLDHDPPSGGITAEVLADEVEVHIDSRGRLQLAGVARGWRSRLDLAVVSQARSCPPSRFRRACADAAGRAP